MTMWSLEGTWAELRCAALAVGLAAGVAASASASGLRVAESPAKVWTGRWAELRMGLDHPNRAEGERFAREQKQRWEEAEALVEEKGLAELAQFLRRELAEFRVDKQTQGLDFAHASVELLGLTAAASWQTEYPGRWELLVDLRMEFGKLCVEAGCPELITGTYSRSLLLPDGMFVDPYELVPASAELLAQDAVALASPRLAAFIAELQSPGAPQAAQQPSPAPGIEDAVREALARANSELILELGSRATPVLEEIIRADLDAFPQDFRSDPLVSLLEIRELKGAELILELWDRGGFLFKKRVIRAMVQAKVLEDSGTWLWTTHTGGWGAEQPPTLVESIWLDVLARLAADPDAGRDSMDLAGIVARLDGLDARLQQALIKLLDSDDPDAASGVMEVLKLAQGRESVVPILEHALGHRVAAVRAAAAGGLVYYARSAALRARCGDEERNVRQAVARSMLGSVGRPVYRESDRSVQWQEGHRAILHLVEESDAGCLAELMKDSDAGVRELAVQVLFEHPELPIPPAVALSLARDPSSKVRGWLAHWPPQRPADPKVLEVLAQDSDPEVLKELDERMEELATRKLDGSVALDQQGNLAPGVDLMWRSSYVPALVARLTNASSPYLQLRVALVVAGNDPKTAPFLLQGVQSKGTEVARLGLVQAMSAGVDSGYPFAWDAIEPQDLVAWIRTVWELPTHKGPKAALIKGTRNASGKIRAAFRPLLADTKLPEDLRFFAALRTASIADAGWCEDFLVLLANSQPWPSGSETSRSWWMKEIAGSIPDEQTTVNLIAELIRMSEPPAWALVHLTGSLAQSYRSLPADVASELLERHGQRTGDEWTTVLSRALTAFEPSEEKPQTELLQRLMTNERLVEFVLPAVARAHLPQHLPMLEEALLGRGSFASGWEQEVQGRAAQALASYLSDDAAEILLKGLGSTTDEEVRKAFFDALDTIRRYQDEKARWTQRKGSKQAQDVAIAELVPMLADKDANVRAQAARSLGALEAVEHLPALVRLLKDAAPEVRTAAQSAIDALTAPKPAPAEGAKRD
jgi:HEAT repeat protein